MSVLKYPNLVQDGDDGDEIIELIRNELIPILRRTRRQRQMLTEQWIRYDNIWNVRPDSQSYSGRTRTYLATGRRVIENWVTKLKQDLFPATMSWSETTSDNLEGEDQVPVWDSLWKKFFRQMQLRRVATPWLRTLVTIGTAPVDVGFKYASERVEVIRRQLDGRVRTSKDELTRYLGPTFRPIPPWRFYVYPATVIDLHDAQLMFEDFLMDPRQAEYLGNTPIASNDESLGNHFERIDDLLSTLPKPGANRGNADRFAAQIRQLAARGLSSPAQGQDDPHQALVMCKCFWQAQLADEPFPVWYQIVIGADDVVVSVRRVWSTAGVPTHLCAKFMEKEDEFYGYGVASSIDTLQYQINDVANQSGDALTWSLSPAVGIDPGMVQDHTTLKMRPGAKWLVRNPRASISPIEFPKDSAVAGQAAVQQLIGLANDVANVAPYGGAGAVGRSRGRAVSTLGGMQMIAGDALVQVADVIANVEDSVLNQALSQWESMTVQCMDIPLIVKVEGARGAALVQRQITRDDLVGDFTHTWAGSTSNFNLQVRGMQINNFIGTVARIPPQILASDNIQIGWEFLLKSAWSMGFQLPQADRVVRKNIPVTSMDPSIENELLRVGRFEDVHVSPADDDSGHLKVHLELAMEQRDLDPAVVAALHSHVQRHELAMIAKQLMAQQQAMQGQVGGGTSPGGGGQPSLPGGGPGMATPGAMGGNPIMRGALPPGPAAGPAGLGSVARMMPRVPGVGDAGIGGTNGGFG